METIKCMWLLAAMATGQAAFAQQENARDENARDEKARLALNIGLGNQYRFTAAGSPLEKHYGIGGQLDLVFNDRWMISYAQSGSLAPADLLNTPAADGRKTHLYEYTLGAGYKSPLGSSVYLIGRAGFGIAALKTAESDRDQIRDGFSPASGSSFLVAPELAVGIRLNRLLALQSGASYRFNLGGLEKSGAGPVNASDLNGLAVNLTLIGTIPLLKR